ncbi:MAG: ribonuclease BN (tRNA processing enzyme) [Polyangiales bacterium]|jgi:ribonuclease BN (tRNA processing enzyme)
MSAAFRSVGVVLFVAACGAASTDHQPSTRRQPDAVPAVVCEGLAVQVLGSGGPRSSGGRVSSGYLVWRDGRARFLVDAGPGVTHRLNASGASVRDLDAVFISHLHVDHSADLVALLKMASFGSRQRSLALFGPHGSDRFPAIDDFVAAQIGPSGAYPYLGGFLTRGQPFVLDTRRVAGSQAELVFESGDDRVRAIAVAHGPVPALAYDVDLGGRRVAFMGDQRADDPRYVDMIRGADVLIAHMAIPERSPGVAAQLHAPPGRLGRVAEEAGVGAMVISHVMQRSLVNLDENLAAIREHYAGTLVVADDLDCFSLD